METSLRQNAIKMIGTLNGQPLLYALKSPDTELYDFGFGNLVDSVNRHGIRKEIAEVSLHILCRFKVIWQNHERGVDEYFEDTPSKLFHSEIKRLIGLTVRRTALSKKNDLWLDFGDCWVVFATREDGEESWRMLTTNDEIPHLVVSDSWVSLID